MRAAWGTRKAEAPPTAKAAASRTRRRSNCMVLSIGFVWLEWMGSIGSDGMG